MRRLVKQAGKINYNILIWKTRMQEKHNENINAWK